MKRRMQAVRAEARDRRPVVLGWAFTVGLVLIVAALDGIVGGGVR